MVLNLGLNKKFMLQIIFNYLLPCDGEEKGDKLL